MINDVADVAEALRSCKGARSREVNAHFGRHNELGITPIETARYRTVELFRD